MEFKIEHYLLLEVVKQCLLSAKTNSSKPVRTVSKKIRNKKWGKKNGNRNDGHNKFKNDRNVKLDLVKRQNCSKNIWNDV